MGCDTEVKRVSPGKGKPSRRSQLDDRKWEFVRYRICHSCLNQRWLARANPLTNRTGRKDDDVKRRPLKKGQLGFYITQKDDVYMENLGRN